MRWIALLLQVFVLAGCANGYQQFYQSYPGVTPETIAKIRAAPPPATPQVEHIPSFDISVFEAYAKHGYVAVGDSSFNSGEKQPDTFAIEQGRAVGADLVVIVNPRYTGTVTTSVPITTPTTATSYSSGVATTYGSYGTVNAYGNGVTTTYGTRTTYMPLVIHRNAFSAVYFIKRHHVLGALFRDLNDSERQALQTNKGAVITVVVNDSPAFKADLLKGDIVTSINGQPVTNAQEYSATIAADAGQTVNLSILRGDKYLEKSVQLLQ